MQRNVALFAVVGVRFVFFACVSFVQLQDGSLESCASFRVGALLALHGSNHDAVSGGKLVGVARLVCFDSLCEEVLSDDVLCVCRV